MESNNELPTHRMVNGVQVPYTEVEKTDLLASWQQYRIDAEAKRIADELEAQAQADKQAKIDAFIDSL